MGTPEKSQLDRILFSKNREYESVTYWGKLQKKAKVGYLVGS